MPRRNYPSKSKEKIILGNSVKNELVRCRQKRRFNSKDHAIRAIEDASLMSSPVNLNVYHCNFCQGWHLTSLD